MTQKEANDLAIDIGNYFSQAEKQNASELVNTATATFKTILERYPKIRYELWCWNQEHILDELGLDYGNK